MRSGASLPLMVLAACAPAAPPTPPQAPPPPALPPPATSCTPAQPCWPSAADWAALRAQVHGHLEQPAPSPPPSPNPYALQDAANGFESRGWLGAWQAAPSPYAVAAEGPADVAAAIAFATAHRLKLVVKNTGHDYLGRSSAPDSLMIWTHPMRAIEVEDAFVPAGCAVPPVPAVSLGAGVRWGEAYQAVSIEHHRYVQGGGCTTVGAAGGFLQGGGFGSFSRAFGVAAASLLEAEVVTADGQTRIANACQNADLFWALRGGGGGTFGVVTRATLATYPLPATFGVVHGSIHAPTPAAYRALVGEFLAFSRDHLLDAHWGESVELKDDSLNLRLVIEGLTQAEADAAWAPFRAWLAAHAEDTGAVQVQVFPAGLMWNAPLLHRVAPDQISLDDRPGAPPTSFWWAGDGAQVGAYWSAYTSRWIPRALFGTDALADALVAASRQWSLELHFNKALAGAAPDAIARTRATAVNPAVVDAAALVIIAAAAPAAERVPDPARGADERAHVAAAMAEVRAVTPDAGAYVNEADYFEPDWQRAFWGANYARLLAIKRAVDPANLFTCHHCVGSE